jgi:hypothetical protein
LSSFHSLFTDDILFPSTNIHNICKFLKHNIFVHGMANLGLINTNEFRSALDFETLLPFEDDDDPLLVEELAAEVAVFFKTLGTKDNW